MEAHTEARSTDVETRERLLAEAAHCRQQAARYHRMTWRYAQEAHAAGAKVSQLAAALGISRTAVYKQLNRKEG